MAVELTLWFGPNKWNVLFPAIPRSNTSKYPTGVLTHYVFFLPNQNALKQNYKFTQTKFETYRFQSYTNKLQ